MPLSSTKLKGGFSLALTKTEKTLYTAVPGGIRAYNTEDWDSFDKRKVLSNAVYVSLSNDNTLVAVKNTLGNIALLRAEDGFILKKYQMEKAEGEICLFSPDDKYVLDADWNGNIMLIDLEKQAHSTMLTVDGFQINAITYNDNTKEFVLFFSRVHLQNKYFSEGDLIAVVWKYPIITNSYRVVQLPNVLDHICGKITFNKSSNCYIAVGHGKITIFDYRFNVIKELSITANDYHRAVLSNTKKYLLIFTQNYFDLYSYPELVLISRFRGIGRPSDALFFNDDQTLIICGWNSSLVINLDI